MTVEGLEMILPLLSSCSKMDFKGGSLVQSCFLMLSSLKGVTWKEEITYS